MENRVNHVVGWLQDQVKLSGTKGLIVGLSGGIDSAVVACLIKKAMGDKCMGVILPCKSNEKDKTDALALVDACGIEAVEVELSSTHDILLEGISKALSKSEFDNRLTDANLRARLRMTTIYGIANELNYLVVGTDNAAELLTGYFTKHGDGGVDILPLAHLTKREVFEWASYLGVPQSIIDRKPSAGLWEGQTDEDEMGVTYDEIDDYIEGKPVSEASVAIIEKMHRVSDHKRKMPPVPPKF